MSASLVGSEMCIRDRTNFEAVSGPAQFQVRTLEASLACSIGAGATLFGSCLLYTSDAADDM
eukprot:11284102-Alexandrium_andersonii.AAC.1